MGDRMDVVYFGSGAFGVPTLRALAERHTVRAVVTQPDRPAGRGRKLTPNPIAAFAAEHLPDAELIKPEKVNDPEVVARVRAFPADAWVVIAFGQKLGTALLADRFAINLHASLLPRWRGAAPINHAILAGDTQTGNSVITLADRMDAGLVLGRSTRDIRPDQTMGELHDELSADGPEMMLDVLERHRAGTLDPETQDESLVTLAGKLSRADAVVDFTKPADVCRARINGLSPWPGVAVELGGQRVKLLRASAEDAGPDHEQPPGTLIDAPGGLVACGSGVLRILDVHPAGGRAMGWATFARAGRIAKGDAVRAPETVRDEGRA
ncbi:MAG: methionyl-tRNA formyltransferase [Phycisphaeraceae bacterium]|nr:MAG: methionyl-tRNA formyltransferase [Phycisphaeraceae bacterium]